MVEADEEEWTYLTPEELAEQQKIKTQLFRDLLDKVKFNLGPTMTCNVKELIPGHVLTVPDPKT